MVEALLTDDELDRDLALKNLCAKVQNFLKYIKAFGCYDGHSTHGVFVISK